MKRIAFVSLLSAALSLSASPAAGFPMDGSPFDRQTGAFAGGTLRLDFGARRSPTARLGIGFEHSYRDATGAVARRVQPPGIELGLRGGRPELFVSGHSVRDVERRLGAAGSTGTLLVIGGLAVGAAAVVVLTSGDDENDGPCPPGVEVCAQN